MASQLETQLQTPTTDKMNGPTTVDSSGAEAGGDTGPCVSSTVDYEGGTDSMVVKVTEPQKSAHISQESNASMSENQDAEPASRYSAIMGITKRNIAKRKLRKPKSSPLPTGQNQPLHEVQADSRHALDGKQTDLLNKISNYHQTESLHKPSDDLQTGSLNIPSDKLQTGSLNISSDELQTMSLYNPSYELQTESLKKPSFDIQTDSTDSRNQIEIKPVIVPAKRPRGRPKKVSPPAPISVVQTAVQSSNSGPVIYLKKLSNSQINELSKMSSRNFESRRSKVFKTRKSVTPSKRQSELMLSEPEKSSTSSSTSIWDIVSCSSSKSVGESLRIRSAKVKKSALARIRKGTKDVETKNYKLTIKLGGKKHTVTTGMSIKEGHVKRGRKRREKQDMRSIMGIVSSTVDNDDSASAIKDGDISQEETDSERKVIGEMSFVSPCKVCEDSAGGNLSGTSPQASLSTSRKSGRHRKMKNFGEDVFVDRRMERIIMAEIQQQSIKTEQIEPEDEPRQADAQPIVVEPSGINVLDELLCSKPRKRGKKSKHSKPSQIKKNLLPIFKEIGSPAVNTVKTSVNAEKEEEIVRKMAQKRKKHHSHSEKMKEVPGGKKPCQEVGGNKPPNDETITSQCATGHDDTHEKGNVTDKRKLSLSIGLDCSEEEEEKAVKDHPYSEEDQTVPVVDDAQAEVLRFDNTSTGWNDMAIASLQSSIDGSSQGDFDLPVGEYNEPIMIPVDIPQLDIQLKCVVQKQQSPAIPTVQPICDEPKGKNELNDNIVQNRSEAVAVVTAHKVTSDMNQDCPSTQTSTKNRPVTAIQSVVGSKHVKSKPRSKMMGSKLAVSQKPTPDSLQSVHPSAKHFKKTMAQSMSNQEMAVYQKQISPLSKLESVTGEQSVCDEDQMEEIPQSKEALTASHATVVSNVGFLPNAYVKKHSQKVHEEIPNLADSKFPVSTFCLFLNYI